MSERVYTTGDDRGSISYLPNGVEQLPAAIRKVTITDEGKLQIVLEGTVGDEATLNQVRNLLLSQHNGPVLVDITGTQGELDL